MINKKRLKMGNFLGSKCQVCLRPYKVNKKKLRLQNEDEYLTAIHDGTRECLECYRKHPSEKNRINRLALHEMYKFEENKKYQNDQSCLPITIL